MTEQFLCGINFQSRRAGDLNTSARQEGVFGCNLHPNDKIKNEFESDKGDDDYLPVENYDGDDEEEDELCAGDFDVKWDDL